MTGDDAAQQLEHQADQLEHHLEELGDHISDAEKSAAHLREKTNPETVGDFENTRGTPGQGEDPEGAAEAAPADEAQTATGQPDGSASDDAPPRDSAGDDTSADAQPRGSAGDDQSAAADSGSADAQPRGSAGDDSDADDSTAADDDTSAADAGHSDDDAVGGSTPGHASGGDD